MVSRVLIVDDSEDLHEVYEMILLAEGHEIARAYDGGAGLRQVENFRPEVVLLDMMMPEVDGLTFLERLPRECTPPLPAVVANSGMEDYREEALRRGACSFLLKPASVGQLLSALAAAQARTTLDGEVVADNQRWSARARAEGAAASAGLVALIPPGAMTPLRGEMRALAEWLRGYFGFGTACMQLVRDNQLWIEAAYGDAGVEEGDRFPRTRTYCDFVLTAGSTVVLSEPERHPLPVISGHQECAAGYHFYAGVPLTTREGTVIGTLCILDKRPHEVHAEDMRLLESVGLQVAAAMEGIAFGMPVEEFVCDEAGILSSTMLPVMVDVSIRHAARSGGTVGLALVDVGSDLGVARCAAAWAIAELGPRLAVVRRGRHQLAVVTEGEQQQVLATLREVCAIAGHGGDVLCAGIGLLAVEPRSELSDQMLHGLHVDLYRLAADSRGEAMEQSGGI